MSSPRVVVVTDPMCSWCWGMAHAVDDVVTSMGAQVDFDILLGGINVHGTQPIGDYGRRYLMRLWRDVEETTGQPFGYKLPDEYVHNSSRSCVAVEAVRQLTGKAPFDYLHELQSLFFTQGLDVTSVDVLVAAAEKFDLDADQFVKLLDDPAIIERVRFQFNSASAYGTNALPCVLIDVDGTLRLLAGGYADGDMLRQLVTEQVAQSES